MAVLLITYDLIEGGSLKKNYTKLIEKIKEQGTWAKPTESCFLIKTAKQPRDVYDALSEYADENDSLLVITVTTPYRAYLNKDVINWMTSNLG